MGTLVMVTSAEEGGRVRTSRVSEECSVWMMRREDTGVEIVLMSMKAMERPVKGGIPASLIRVLQVRCQMIMRIRCLCD